MATPLSAPTNVQTAPSTDNTKIHVSWDTSNANTDVSGYLITFEAKDGSAAPTITGTAAAKDRSFDIAPPAGTAVSDFIAKNHALVVAKAEDPNTNTDSTPGIQPYWNYNFALTITIADKQLTLTKPSGSSGDSGGVYRLASSANPITITPADINSIVGHTVVPDSLFGKTASLTISDFAVDTDNSLFEFAVDAELDLSLFSGLTINSLTFKVERTDGVTILDAPAPASPAPPATPGPPSPTPPAAPGAPPAAPPAKPKN